MTSQEETIKISLYLHKKEVDSFEECIKKDVINHLTKYTVDSSIGLPGRIYVHETIKKLPKWYSHLSELTTEKIKIDENASNKATITLKHDNRYFSITYGYGKSILDESTIVRNFGLMTGVNLIDSERIKSVDSMSIEDVIIDTQKQSSSMSNQKKLQVDQFKEILKSVSGVPSNEEVAKFIVGTDSLNFTHKMDIRKIKEKIVYLYGAYKNDNYKKNGFGWLDNIKRVKDKTLSDELNKKLCRDILNGNQVINIAPNRVLDWSEINGFYLTGMRTKKEEKFEIDSEEYFEFIRKKHQEKNIDILGKIKRDKLKAVYSEDDDKSISNIYQSIIYECELNAQTYILTFGEWFEIKTEYYEAVTDFINNLPECNLALSEHIKSPNEEEGDYNKRVTDNDIDLSLMDKNNYRAQGYGRSSVEPCDIVSRDYKLIHVKKRGKSSELSHLFSQAVVAAKVLANDDGLREHINNAVSQKFGPDFIPKDYSNADLEIVFAVITDKNQTSLSEYLPFFSRVNLMQAVNNLKEHEYKYSMLIIKSN